MMCISHIKPLACWVVIWLFFNMPAALTQGTVSFESDGPTREVPEGNRFEVSFSLKNTFAKRFIPPDFKGFRVTAGPSEMRGSGFINGKSYSHQTWTYELEAGEPGNYTIGSATVQTDDRTLRTQPLVIRVGKARPSRTAPPPGADERVFVSAELGRESAWVGQQLHYQIKLYTQVGITEYDILDLPQFEGFYFQERQRFDTRMQYQTIKGRRYAVRILHEICLFPQQTGKLRIGPSRIRLGIEQPGSLSALFGSRPELLQTQPVMVNVKPLPEPPPANFSGAVGTYKWQISADHDTLTTDDALTLTIVVEGNGDARRFANPVFELPAGLEGFEPKIPQQEEYETGEQFVHSRTLEYAILPRQPGDYSFLPQLVIFDPDSNKYRTLRPDSPVHIHVTKGRFYGQENVLSDTIAGIPPPPPSLLDRLWQNAHQWLLLPLVRFAPVLLLLLLAVAYWWRRRRLRQHPAADASIAEARERPTRKQLRGKMQALAADMVSLDSRTFYSDLLKTIQEYVALYVPVEPVLITKDLMQAQLAERQVPAQTIQALAQVWQNCEQVVFAGQEARITKQTAWQQADAALQQLDVMLK